MWNRLFGKPKAEKPAATLDDASKSVDERGGKVDDKLKKMDAELLGYKKQMAKMRPGPARKQIEQRALRLLKQKKMYEKQRESLYNQSFNIDQTRFAQENVKESVVMVEAMKNANTELKASMKAVDIDAIEDLHDDMSEMLEMADEVQDVMGRSYDTTAVDEDELLDELNQLDDTIDAEVEAESATAEVASVDADATPNYLVSAASAANKITAAPATAAAPAAAGAPAKQVVTVKAGGGSAKPFDASAMPAPPTRKLME